MFIDKSFLIFFNIIRDFAKSIIYSFHRHIYIAHIMKTLSSNHLNTCMIFSDLLYNVPQLPPNFLCKINISLYIAFIKNSCRLGIPAQKRENTLLFIVYSLNSHFLRMRPRRFLRDLTRIANHLCTICIFSAASIHLENLKKILASGFSCDIVKNGKSTSSAPRSTVNWTTSSNLSRSTRNDPNRKSVTAWHTAPNSMCMIWTGRWQI